MVGMTHINYLSMYKCFSITKIALVTGFSFWFTNCKKALKFFWKILIKTKTKNN